MRDDRIEITASADMTAFTVTAIGRSATDGKVHSMKLWTYRSYEFAINRAEFLARDAGVPVIDRVLA